MAMANFDQAFDDVIGVEGGFVNDPNDPGGATNWGVTIGELRRWRGKPVTVDDVKNLPKEEAKAIYYQHYWKPFGFDLIESDLLATTLFDQAVNRGPSTAIRMLEQIEHFNGDGKLSADEIEKLNHLDLTDVDYEFVKAAVRGYAKLVKHPFILGWENRALILMDRWKESVTP